MYCILNAPRYLFLYLLPTTFSPIRPLRVLPFFFQLRATISDTLQYSPAEVHRTLQDARLSNEDVIQVYMCCMLYICVRQRLENRNFAWYRVLKISHVYWQNNMIDIDTDIQTYIRKYVDGE